MLSFVVCVGLTLWLWNRQGQLPNVIGEVEAVRVDVAAGTSGLLVPLDRPPWTLFEQVHANQVVARVDRRVDPRLIEAQLETLRADLDRLGKELKATAASTALTEADRKQDYLRESTRLAFELEGYRLGVLDRKAQIQADRLDLQRLDARLAFLDPLFQKNLVSEMELTNERMLREVVAKRIEENLGALGELERQVEEAQARLDQLPKFQTADIVKVLEPLHAAIGVQGKRIEELELVKKALEIVAPTAGKICAIYHRPGESVRAGDPILTITEERRATEERGASVIAYIRPEQRLRPEVGMPVTVRARALASRPMAAVVERVGPQVEPVPLHLCRDPKIAEWGLPVRITLPEGFPARPGELVEVSFQGWGQPAGQPESGGE